MKIAASLCVTALLALLVYGTVSKNGGRDIENALAAGQRPLAHVRAGQVVGERARKASLRDFRGRYVLLNFWASWCAPCAEEAPALDRFARAHAKDLVVLGANVSDVDRDALRFAARHGLRFTSIKYSRHDAGRDFGLTGLPETFLIDPSGRVAAVRRFQVDAEWLDGLLPVIRGG